MNAAKDGEKRGKCEEWGKKNSHWHVGPDLEKVQLFGPFVGNSRGRIQVGTEAHHVLRFNHWKSDERAKNSGWTPHEAFEVKWKHLIDHRIKGLFPRVLSLFLPFQSREAFVDCTNEPVIGLLCLLPFQKTAKQKSADALGCTSRCQSVAALNIFWLNAPLDPTEAGQPKYQESLLTGQYHIS